MKPSLKYILIFISVVCIIISCSYKDKTQGKPLKYCYENFRKLDHYNAVLVLTDIKYKTEYLKYYTDVENGEEPILDNKLEFLFFSK